MALDFETLDSLRSRHPAWRLLNSPHAPLVVSFLYETFVLPNVRNMAASDLAETLEDKLFALRQACGVEAFPKTAVEYLNDWAGTDKGWLRKFYVEGSDEPFFDLTPATEKVIRWLDTLMDRSFVGTESRLLTLFELLRQMSEGSERNPEKRIAELMRKRAEIDQAIADVREGKAPLLDDTALRDRFQQFMQTARELLSDFREVEQNFRRLDRLVRERITLWDGPKGELLEDVMGERDAISESDQGRSFRAFWDFLMSSSRQEEFSERLSQVLSLPALTEMAPDSRIRRVHYDWLEAGEHTQRTVALLSQQLRRFLDDQAWLENRRIMQLFRSIEAKALELRGSQFERDFFAIDEACADIELPMERRLHAPPAVSRIEQIALELGQPEGEADELYSQVVVDEGMLIRRIARTLQDRSQTTLCELVAQHPLQHGLAELIAYFHLRAPSFRTVLDETTCDLISWRIDEDPTLMREAKVPRLIFVR